uniref:SLBP_RNA_bind domain-containing protein n=1 Tax=Haemonchus contortus TaxID=6289 RepID=A0A7I5E6Y0_HAECO
MAPSPRKTRTSPRKKAWASPPKSVTKNFSSIFSDADFSPLNSSWAEITANDESLNESLLESLSKSESRRGRKASVPKKANSKPKFVRSLNLTQEVFGNGRRSERKEKIEVVVVEKKTQVDESSLRSKESRKRHLSAASSATLNEDCEGCSPIKRAPPNGSMSTGRPARKNLKTSTPTRSPFRSRCLFPSESRSTSGDFTPKDFWEDPTLGWCKDQAVLDRRTKEIERAKEKPIYARYLQEIPRHLRIKGVHPRTPNKHINFSRRSWDVQIRTWKRSLYNWAGEEPSDSVNTSFCSYSSDELKQDDVEQENRSQPVFRSITEIEEIQVRPETDAMASLLGRFDMDSRRGDESTLKAPTNGQRSDGPVDFSTLKA